MKIYTKTGDKGQTSLFGGKRVSKASIRVEAYGTVDELNSAIGIAIAVAQVKSSKLKVQSNSSKLKTELEQIQNDLLEIGSTLASPGNKESKGSQDFKKRVTEFEKLIDEMTSQLPELRNFILPGGSILGAQLHMVRTIARRAERRIIELSQKEDVDTTIIMYFNRLSDLLFTMARWINVKSKQKEQIWRK